MLGNDHDYIIKGGGSGGVGSGGGGGGGSSSTAGCVKLTAYCRV